jgi:hypothetical protein
MGLRNDVRKEVKSGLWENGPGKLILEEKT